MIRLTRLNPQTVAINPDNILWAEETPDTTLCLVGGDKLMVRESLDELTARVIEYQQQVHAMLLEGRFLKSPDAE
jgi:flagellar protein FlbD